eukprot:2725925-Pyramimonas_sp.AAC.1
MQSRQSQLTLHLAQNSEHCPQTGRLQGPPALWAPPGHLFSARGGHIGPGSQQAPRMEIVLTLRDDPEPDRSADLW